jgi:hypothetical protein
MKIAGKIIGGIVVILVLLLVVLRITGFNPIGNAPGPGNYPGLWLSGKVVNAPVTDWSFAKQYKTDKLQTRTSYLIPHSVTTGFMVHDGQLYIMSIFGAGVPYPQGKKWVANVTRDPHVRLKLGDNLYDCILTPVTDADERAAVLGPRARASKTGNGPTTYLFHAVSDSHT